MHPTLPLIAYSIVVIALTAVVLALAWNRQSEKYEAAQSEQTEPLEAGRAWRCALLAARLIP